MSRDKEFAVGRNPANQMYGKPYENYGKTVIYVICSISTLQNEKWMASFHTKCTAYEHWGMNASHIT